MRLVDLVFRGISQRNYQQVTRECADSFGLSASTVSRIFQARTGQILREFEERDLSTARYVVVMMDATKIRDRHIMICLGITQAGTKTVLGFAELFTENAEAIEGLLMRMIQRGLRYEQGILFVVDGAKGIHGAITSVFGGYAHLQRCTQHKRENVKGYLRSEKQKSSLERKLNAVYLGDQTRNWKRSRNNWKKMDIRQPQTVCKKEWRIRSRSIVWACVWNYVPICAPRTSWKVSMPR